MVNVQDLNGSDRAAIFLMSLDEREATEVLKHMPVQQVQKEQVVPQEVRVQQVV